MAWQGKGIFELATAIMPKWPMSPHPDRVPLPLCLSMSIGMAFSCQRAISTHPPVAVRCVHLSRFIALPPEKDLAKGSPAGSFSVTQVESQIKYLGTREWRDQEPALPGLDRSFHNRCLSVSKVVARPINSSEDMTSMR